MWFKYFHKINDSNSKTFKIRKVYSTKCEKRTIREINLKESKKRRANPKFWTTVLKTLFGKNIFVKTFILFVSSMMFPI